MEEFVKFGADSKCRWGHESVAAMFSKFRWILGTIPASSESRGLVVVDVNEFPDDSLACAVASKVNHWTTLLAV